jgi:hypothetical protein
MREYARLPLPAFAHPATAARKRINPYPIPGEEKNTHSKNYFE